MTRHRTDRFRAAHDRRPGLSVCAVLPIVLALVAAVLPARGGGPSPAAGAKGNMNLRFVPGSKTDLTWDRVDGAESYGLYRGAIRPGRDFWREYHCHATEIVTEFARDFDTPTSGTAFYYVVGWMNRDSVTGDLEWHGEDGRTETSDRSYLSCGERLYVDPAAPEGGDGKSWETAYRSVSEAFAHPTSRDRSFEIWISGDVGDRDDVEVPENGAFLRGGFRGDEVEAWERLEGTASSCPVLVRDGESVRPQVVWIERLRFSDDGGVFLRAGIENEYRLRLFVDDAMFRAEPLWVESTATSDVLVQVEHTLFDGAGLRVTGEGYLLDLVVEDCRFEDAGIRTGLDPDVASATNRISIARNEFLGGQVAVVVESRCLSDEGQYTGGRIANNVFSGYRTAVDLHCCASPYVHDRAECRLDLAITHNTITGNGTGISLNAEAHADPGEAEAICAPRIWNNIVAFNDEYGVREGPENHDGASDSWTDPKEFVTNDLFGNGCMYLDEGTHELNSTSEVNALDGAADNLDVDPRFVDRAAADFHLREDSPLVDRGAIDAPGAGLVDMDGEPRVMDGDHDGYAWPDVGADEVP